MMRQSENGNVIILIFIIVALFAGLIFAFMQGNRGSTAMITGEQAQAYATDIVAYGNDLATAVKRLKLRGCSETDISFENDLVGGFANGSSPTSKKCHVFDINGGGINPKLPKQEYLNSAWSGSVGFEELIFSGQNAIEGLGTTCAADSCVEMVFFVTQIRDELCKAINVKLGIGDIIPTDNDADVGNKFTGTYSFGQVIGESDADIEAEPAGCFYESSTSEGNHFYQVLLAR